MAQEVQLKNQDVYPDLPEAARRLSTTIGIWHLLFNKNVKVTEVWLLRELTVDEYYRKVNSEPQGSALGLDNVTLMVVQFLCCRTALG